MADRYEVIIVGGGMAGATAACALAHGGVKVALLDGHNPERKWPAGSVDIRVSALTKASQNILERVGAWPGMMQRGVCAYRDMRVFDARGGGELHFDCADTDSSELGHIVENRVTVAALWDELATLPSAICLTSVLVSELQLDAKARQVKLDDGRLLEAELVIAADGSESALRTMMGIEVTGWDYHQSGLVATVTTEKSHQATAWQRFLDEGPLAFLPLKNGQCSIVWTLKSETAKKYLALNDEDFLQMLEKASGGILGKMLAAGPRAAFPLRFQYARRYTDKRFALIGDAAHVMHPLAGQGANAGLLDAAAIAELVIKTRQERRPLSSSRFLRSYERWRKGDNLVMMASMDVINKIYQLTLPPFVGMRSAGMNRVNDTALLKTYFNQYAMGLREDLPRLAKGQACW
ncbi:2-octaprenylphenol hydroxylase [Candidatus Methylobacter favarea]|uniref:2-octaprenylphenol hydroxylase n=1 Tax=Candidatus Methylobacter favarea TaxID=2707345 RepID=A0A8S0Y8X0_9GAMM|nr:UbiH/UbiF/VisC/COQ6 family ubiquinone biosynthesis hydroxylase [Candidatus Methylobacter favarea]CAA9889396.1 2-octaprenylphenol hydroxylase [Candidatus Methylobacter favarea]